MKKTRGSRRTLASNFVSSLNTVTKCVKCGDQPIEWHREEHEKYPNSRVSSLRTQGASIDRIKKEIKLCTPLCRRCHMKEDGRLVRLKANQPYQKGKVYVGKQKCKNCPKKQKPLRKGMCYTCYEKQRAGGRSFKS